MGEYPCHPQDDRAPGAAVPDRQPRLPQPLPPRLLRGAARRGRYGARAPSHRVYRAGVRRGGGRRLSGHERGRHRRRARPHRHRGRARLGDRDRHRRRRPQPRVHRACRRRARRKDQSRWPRPLRRRALHRWNRRNHAVRPRGPVRGAPRAQRQPRAGGRPRRRVGSRGGHQAHAAAGAGQRREVRLRRRAARGQHRARLRH